MYLVLYPTDCQYERHSFDNLDWSVPEEAKEVFKQLYAVCRNDYKSATYDSDRQGFYQTQLSRFVNSFDFDEKAAAKAMASDHRTVQQAYMRLVCSFIEEMAKQPSCDDRNRASVDVAKQLYEITKNAYLPLV